ncbi:MAG: UDP-glucose 4-epimerase GalE [Deltaproteobacteria bacterium]|nr:UDP-glucose 4-epimerase GalE [Deltaproteobacteria bacterium]
MNGRILVTGGAGYIGSHTVLNLVRSGCEVFVLDNLQSGCRRAVSREASFHRMDILRRGGVPTLIRRYGIDAVIHFAARTVAPESFAEPAEYYRTNVLGSRRLLQHCIEHGVNRFVFSSSAAVYGIPRHRTVGEDGPLAPISPYGRTKLTAERMLRDLAAASGGKFRFVALRCFNVAGAHMGGMLGQATSHPAHLVKAACQAALGLRPELSIFGDGHPTPDGTCIRDYIHVDDVADAHLRALQYLQAGGDSAVLNCGCGRGYSVREVIECVKSASGSAFPVVTRAPRRGDPPALVADTDRVRRLLGWSPRFDDLATMCRSSLEWERKLSERPTFAFSP